MASVLGCCTGCDTKWSGEKYCHCGKCHITTSTISNWDKHRVNGSCVGPETVGLVRNERGVWTMPGSGFFEVDDD